MTPDVDGDSLTVNLLTNPSNGTLTQNADGSFTYTPNENFNGTDSYTYEACDPGGLCDQATVTITVTPVNDPPVANDDQAVTDEDTPVVIDVTDNDNAGPANEDQTLTVTQVSDPPNGTVTINPDDTVTYTPDSNFSGTDTFTYTVCDSEGLCDTATVTVVVNPSNDPPVANDDSATTNEDTPVDINAATNDTDPDGNLDPSSATVLSGPSDGTVVNNGDGTFTYTPDENFYGQDEFTYQICDDGTPDGQVLCDTATVTIDVLSVNDSPVALDDSYSTPEDTTLTVPAPGILGNDSDVDGDTLTVNLLTNPSNGTLSQNTDGSFTYTPNENFNGTDSYTYEACDPGGLCDNATVTIDVTPVNDPPVAVDDAYSTPEDTTLTVAAPGILGNDSDVDGDTLTVNLLTDPTNGSLTQNADGSFTYTPNENFNGTDSYTYEACDPGGLCDQATVTIDVTPVNDSPVALDNSYNTPEDTTLTVPAPGILGNDSDVDGDSLTVNLLTNPSNGTLSQNTDGSFTYTPNENFNGNDSYTYEACDSGGLCDEATVTIDVTPVNDPPVALDNSYSTPEDTTLTVPAPGILGNDSDVDGDSLTVNLLTSTSNGTLSQNPDGSFTYTPNENFNGTDSYTYETCDPSGLCDQATVTITITPVNDPPVALDDAYTTKQDTTLVVSAADGVLVQGIPDYDIDGDSIYVDDYDPVGTFGGTISMNPDGSFEYTPYPGFAGYDTFTYTISDGNGGYDTATVTITVNAKNGRSISVDFVDWTLEGTQLSG